MVRARSFNWVHALACGLAVALSPSSPNQRVQRDGLSVLATGAPRRARGGCLRLRVGQSSLLAKGEATLRVLLCLFGSAPVNRLRRLTHRPYPLRPLLWSESWKLAAFC